MALAHVVVHVLARVLPHMLARVLLHVLARVIIHVHDYYLKTCVRGDHGEQGGDPHQDHHGQLHHSRIWGDGDYFTYNFVH